MKPFPYDTAYIYAKMINAAIRHANSCRNEIVRLRRNLILREAEIEKLRLTLGNK